MFLKPNNQVWRADEPRPVFLKRTTEEPRYMFLKPNNHAWRADEPRRVFLKRNN
jgi:hypothetical protein